MKEERVCQANKFNSVDITPIMVSQILVLFWNCAVCAQTLCLNVTFFVLGQNIGSREMIFNRIRNG